MKLSVRLLCGLGVLSLPFGLFLPGCSDEPDEPPPADVSSASKRAHHHHPSKAGCADGEREGFTDVSKYPDIAGCSGSWSIPGIHTATTGYAPACPDLKVFDTTKPACGRKAGDDSANECGEGCNVADLCAPGWHVCDSAEEVASSSPSGCAGSTQPEDPPLFFASRQTSNGCSQCAIGSSLGPECDSRSCAPGCLQTDRTSNDVFGCGNFGAEVYAPCGALDRFSHNLCDSLPGSPWSCNDPSPADDVGECEAFTVVKSKPSHGGVLCCRDKKKNHPPDCKGAAADPSQLWPPNHKLVPVEVVGVTDPDGDPVKVVITSVFQDEPVNGKGDGNTSPDAEGVGTEHVKIRAERAGSKKVPGDGRVYYLDFTATDPSGGSCSGTVTVCVPHHPHEGEHCEHDGCVGGGPLYDSTAP